MQKRLVCDWPGDRSLSWRKFFGYRGITGSIVDAWYINFVEPDAVLMGVNMVLQWKATVLHLVTDSACTQR